MVYKKVFGDSRQDTILCLDVQHCLGPLLEQCFDSKMIWIYQHTCYGCLVSTEHKRMSAAGPQISLKFLHSSGCSGHVANTDIHHSRCSYHSFCIPACRLCMGNRHVLSSRVSLCTEQVYMDHCLLHLIYIHGPSSPGTSLITPISACWTDEYGRV